MARRRVLLQSKLAWLVLCSALSIAEGCSRPIAVHSAEAEANSPATEQNLPFHQNPVRTMDNSAHPAVPSDGSSGNRTPFPAALRSHSLPPGTLITVWLKDSLAVSHVRKGDTFDASVAEPLTIDGETVIDRGIPVRGRVESAPASADPRTSGPDRGPDASYLRLTLNSITVGGKVVDLQTSTLFAKDTLQPKGSSNGSSTDRGAGSRSSARGIRKGRRLTFRLMSPVTFNSPNSMPNRQDSNTTANK
jgi:hypothetical protein